MARFVKVAETHDLAPGEGESVDVEGLTIALFNIDGVYYAIEDACSHEGGPLGEGALNGDVVACPWHGAEFNVKTGEAVTPPAEDGVRTYPVKVESDDVLIGLD